MTNKKVTKRQRNRNEKRKIQKSNCKKKAVKETHSIATSEPWYEAFPNVPRVWFDCRAMKKFVDLAEADQLHECGGFLIGNLLRDNITGNVITVVEDVYSDMKYGSSSDYSFSVKMQMDCMSYIAKNYGETKHMVGTIHSHAQFGAFFSNVDYTMMNSRISDEVHMVVSPSHREYVLTYKDREFVYHHDAVLMPDVRGEVISYRRKDLAE